MSLDISLREDLVNRYSAVVIKFVQIIDKSIVREYTEMPGVRNVDRFDRVFDDHSGYHHVSTNGNTVGAVNYFV